MYKVFVVEDEIAIRESIREQIPWQQSEFILLGEASDGEMALPMIEELRPDIIVTDIRMPFMDGLQLSRIVKRTMPLTHILVLSGYDEFDLAHQAMQIPVDDYLLKPVGPVDLLATLEKTARRIDDEIRERRRLEELSSRASESVRLMQERFLSDLGEALLDPAEAAERAVELGLGIMSRYYMTALLQINIIPECATVTRYQRYLQSEQNIRAMIEGNESVQSYHRSTRELVLIFQGDDAEALEDDSYTLCRSIQIAVHGDTACGLLVSLGSVHERVGGIARSLREAEEAHRMRYVFGPEVIITYRDAQRSSFSIPEVLRIDCNEIMEAQRCADWAKVEERLREFVRDLRLSAKGAVAPRYLVTNLLVETGRFVEELGGDVETLLPALSLAEQKADPSVDPEELFQFLRRPVRAAYELRESRKKDRYGDMVERARIYIAQEYANPQISLGTVAREVGLSTSHFSTVFSHEAGMTFIEFLTRTRMRKAQELLQTTSMRGSEVAYEVGYNDPHYFGHVFKRETGVTPSAYRKGVSQTGEKRS